MLLVSKGKLKKYTKFIMTKFKNHLYAVLLMMVSCFAISCDDNDEIEITDPNAEFDAVLEVNEADVADPNEDVVVDANTSSTIVAKVSFKSTTVDMKRLYITQNIKGLEETIYEPTENIDLKDDGAVDLTGKNSKEFDYKFTLPVPAGVGVGTVVYKFWTTTGNGDFRDVTKRLAVGPGTITLKFGAATNPSTGTAEINSYTDVKLVAPLGDGSSKTFVSLVDGSTYSVSQGIEYVSQWDFGYLFSVTADAATLRSPYNYPTIAIDIPAKASTATAPVTNADLNKTYFKTSTKTTAEFDAVTKSSDLDFVSVTANDANIVVKQLVANTVVEFVNQYGKKGLIKVLQVNPGNGSEGFIRIAIKVQP
jgi:hypothetical protein